MNTRSKWVFATALLGAGAQNRLLHQLQHDPHPGLTQRQRPGILRSSEESKTCHSPSQIAVT
jgi:hypothetical protein